MPETLGHRGAESWKAGGEKNTTDIPGGREVTEKYYPPPQHKPDYSHLRETDIPLARRVC